MLQKSTMKVKVANETFLRDFQTLLNWKRLQDFCALSYLRFFAKMSLTFQKSLFFILFASICLTEAEIVQNIVTKVSNCFNCGMIEDVGQLDIKICGDYSCCFIQHMDNSGINFLAGQEDLFEGPASLLECYEYLVNNSVWKSLKKSHFTTVK